MESFVAKVKKWGNSKGLIIPSEVDVDVGEEVRASLQSATRVARVRDWFGKLKISVPTSKLLKSVDRDLDPEF